jgi:hypothetical protein
MMELPHGVLVKCFKGPIPLTELNGALQKDSFTGFMRASLFQGSFVEGVIVYGAGKPIMAFTSDGKTDRPDNEQKAITSVTASDDTVIELFSLNDGQLRLAMDFGGDLIIKQAPPPPPPPPKPAARAPSPMPVQRQGPREKPLSMPEVRGSFIKAEDVVSLRSYIEARKDETGHAVLLRQDGASFAEYHLLFLKGKVVAAYSSNEAGEALLNNALAMGGVTEFYRVDEALIHSILKMYPHVATPFMAEPPAVAVKEAPKMPAKPRPEPIQVLRPDSKPYIPLTVKAEPVTILESSRSPAARPAESAIKPSELERPKPMETHRFETSPRQGIGVPAKALFDKGDRQAYIVDSMGTPAPESRSTGALKGDMDDDADFVRKVEKEFVGNVDDLLKRLELSHLKVMPDKKKRP